MGFGLNGEPFVFDVEARTFRNCKALQDSAHLDP
jgi:hypothetical protein